MPAMVKCGTITKRAYSKAFALGQNEKRVAPMKNHCYFSAFAALCFCALPLAVQTAAAPIATFSNAEPISNYVVQVKGKKERLTSRELAKRNVEKTIARVTAGENRL